MDTRPNMAQAVAWAARRCTARFRPGSASAAVLMVVAGSEAAAAAVTAASRPLLDRVKR
jgi:hypothetical protein